MSAARTKNVAASVRQRLLNLSKASGEPFDLVLVRYALERFLFRLSISPFADQFVLKGALLYVVWGNDSYRPTRDGDLLAFGPGEVTRIEMSFKEISGIECEDGIVFDADSMRAVEIAEENVYSGIRTTFVARLERAKIPVQFDIGFGDVITPAAEQIAYPTLLEFPGPALRAYPVYTVLSEKLEAMVKFGMQNSRMKDFYDLWVLPRRFELNGDILANAVSATFARRRTSLPHAIPDGLTRQFADAPAKAAQWTAFLRKNRLPAETELRDVQASIEALVMPVLIALRRGEKFTSTWKPGGPWVENTRQEGGE